MLPIVPEIRTELLAYFPDGGSENTDLSSTLENIFSTTLSRFVVIWDERDAFLRAYPGDHELYQAYFRLFSSILLVQETMDCIGAA